jgi:hypothetical protein
MKVFMLKPVVGNSNYLISLSGEIKDINGNPVEIKENNGNIEIELYGIKTTVSKMWLVYISIFETHFEKPSLSKLLNVNFLDNSVKIPRQVTYKVMVFKNPVTYLFNNKVYRIIPNYTRYAISKEGNIVDIFEKIELNPILNRKIHGVNNTYPEVYLYSAEISSYRYLRIHRLVALAWCKNDNFVFRPIVNHKDGDKTNYHYKNLEWCSFQENSIHAVNNGLREDNVKCKIRDRKSGKVLEFKSLVQASSYMGLKYRLVKSNLFIRQSKLYAGRYELRTEDDDRPWFYENNQHKDCKINTRYIFKCIYKDGEIEYFYDSRDFKNKFKLWNCPKVKDLLYKARILFPDVKFELTDQYESKPVECFNIRTGEIIEAKSIIEMSKIVNLKEHTIRTNLQKPENTTIKGYAFRYKTDKAWDTNFIDVSQKFYSLKLTNIETNEETVFPSIRSAAKALRMDRSTVTNMYKYGYVINNLKISAA